MQNSLSNIESVDNGSSPSAQSSECRTERRKDMQDLRRRLKLQPFSSCKAAIPSSAGEARTEDVSSSDVRNPATYKVFDKFYAQMEEIGQGSCGVVKKVLHLEENLIYAAKIMKTAESENIEQMKREYQILSTFDHKNIIKAKEFFHDETSGSAQLVLEYFPSKNLEELIKEGIKEGRRLEEEKVRQIIQQVVSALKYVHEKGVCHRDITASNILVNDKNEVKLIDFSISRINRQELWSPTAYKNMSSNRKRSDILSGYQTFMISNAGTDAYKAPEIVTGVPYNQSVDMWSLGVVTFYALAGNRPFRSRDATVLYKKISDVDYVWDAAIWANISHEARLFVQACLQKLPFIRLSSKEAYYHPWTKGVKMDWEICEVSERGSEENEENDKNEKNEKNEKNKKNKRKPVVLSPSPSRRDKPVDRRAREKFGKSYALDVATIN